jgi:hypothetical protein
MFLRCHCEERSDAAIQRPFGQPPCFCVVIARSEATRQSSGTIGQPPHRPGIPHHASDWIATSVLFETFLAMTAQGNTPENRNASHPAHSRPPLLSLRGAPRRGNPATVWASPMFLRCHCEERRDAAIQSEPSGIPTHRPGIPFVNARSEATRQSSRNHWATHRITPATPFVIARSEATRQSSRNHRATPDIAPASRITPQTGLPRPNGLAMTA